MKSDLAEAFNNTSRVIIAVFVVVIALALIETGKAHVKATEFQRTKDSLAIEHIKLSIELTKKRLKE